MILNQMEFRNYLAKLLSLEIRQNFFGQKFVFEGSAYCLSPVEFIDLPLLKFISSIRQIKFILSINQIKFIFNRLSI